MGELLGRFHPLIVHLPVGMLILAFVMEIASRQKRLKYLKPAIPFVLLITILSAIFAWFTGWIMPKEGAFDEEIVRYHFWSSLAMTVITILVYLTSGKKSKFHQFYFPFFMLAMILLAVTGHYGGSLTHGVDHLTAPIGQEKPVKTSNVNNLLIYQDIIQPIIKLKCTSCHNQVKKKGGLILSTVEGLKKGGDNGPIYFKGDIEKSSLISYLHLPLEDKKHMPPKGRVQLTKDEIKLLTWWVQESANFENKVGDVNQPEEISPILQKYHSSNEDLNTSNLKRISENEIAELAEHGILAYPLNTESPLLIVNMARNEKLSKSQFRKLKPIAENIVELDLSFSNLDDKLMSYLPKYKNLQKLKIQNSNITSAGLAYLEELEHLKLLNLYGTKVDDDGFESLKKIKNLSEVYLWETKVTKTQVDLFKNDKPLVDVDFQIDNSIFGDVQLKAPIISADKEIFEDTLRITLSRNFKNVAVYYTLDGSDPDTNALKYDSSFLINKTSVIKTISTKEGWTTSAIANKTFVKAGHKIVSMQLSKPPSPKYKASGKKSLYDFKKGTVQFAEGNWLGFEGEHLSASIDLGTNKVVSSVAVGSLEDTGSWIFHPSAIEVSTSMDGKKFSNIEKLKIPIAEAPAPGKVTSFLLNFEERKARFIQLKVVSVLKNPEWHPAPGKKCWLFVDEILVN